MAAHQTAAQLAKSWKTDPRWNGVTRPYSAEDVVRLRGTLPIEYTLARVGHAVGDVEQRQDVAALGAMSGTRQCRWSPRG